MKRAVVLFVLVTLGLFVWACDWGDGYDCPEWVGAGWCPAGVIGLCPYYTPCPGFCLDEEGLPALCGADGGTEGGGG